VKVLDFGISKMARGSSSVPDVSITKTAAIMGSPLYMSPEQLRSSKDVDARSDVWALGVMLFELVSGVSPFTGDTMPELVARILAEPPPPLVPHHPNVPEGLDAVISRALEKEPQRRYESVGQLAGALLPFGSKRARASVDRISGVLRAAGLSASALALPPSSDPAEKGSEATTAASWGRTDSPGRAGKSFAFALAALAVLGGGGYALWHVAVVAADTEANPSLAGVPSAAAPSAVQAALPAPRAAAVPSESDAALSSSAASPPAPAPPVVEPTE
jgi:serine/threonine-protein kinase